LKLDRTSPLDLRSPFRKSPAVHRRYIFLSAQCWPLTKKCVSFSLSDTRDEVNIKPAAATHMSSCSASSLKCYMLYVRNCSYPLNVDRRGENQNQKHQKEKKKTKNPLKHLENVCVMYAVCRQQLHFCFCSVFVRLLRTRPDICGQLTRSQPSASDLTSGTYMCNGQRFVTCDTCLPARGRLPPLNVASKNLTLTAIRSA